MCMHAPGSSGLGRAHAVTDCCGPLLLEREAGSSTTRRQQPCMTLPQISALREQPKTSSVGQLAESTNMSQQQQQRAMGRGVCRSW